MASIWEANSGDKDGLPKSEIEFFTLIDSLQVPGTSFVEVPGYLFF